MECSRCRKGTRFSIKTGSESDSKKPVSDIRQENELRDPSRRMHMYLCIACILFWPGTRESCENLAYL